MIGAKIKTVKKQKSPWSGFCAFLYANRQKNLLFPAVKYGYSAKNRKGCTCNANIENTAANRKEQTRFVTRTAEIEITAEMINEYLNDMETKGRSKSSIESYQTALIAFYNFLPDEKILDETTTLQWRDFLRENGYSQRTINARMSIYNSFLQYLGKREWQYIGQTALPDDVQPEITRAEYLRLLQAAKQLNKERTYLLIKTLAGAGIRLQELPQLTVEALQKGTAKLEHYGCQRLARIPEPLRVELLEYAAQKGITSGPIFVTRDGTPLLRSSVWNAINAVCKTARVEPEKANPRCLWKLYQSTYQGIRDNIIALTDQAYERMLEQEQLTIAWDI